MLALVIFAVFAGANAEPNCADKPPNMRSEECCPTMPMFVTAEAATQCKLPVNITSRHPPCDPYVCILKKGNLVNADNKLNKTNLKNKLTTDYIAQWATPAEASYNTCIKELAVNDPCEARKFTRCFVHNMMMNCPPSARVNSTNCNKSRMFFENCPMMAMRG